MTNDKTRRNEEIQLTKRPERPSPAFCHWDFGFLLSLVIRHWSLTILASSVAVSCSKPSAGGAKRETDDAIPITVAMVDVVPMDQSLEVWGTLYAKDEANLAKAKASANNAELNLKRAEELRKDNIASESDLDAAVAAAEQARAE